MGRPKTLRWPDGTAVGIGQRVRCERERSSRGTWARYDGKRGEISALNASCGEVGVNGQWGSAEAWFTVDELVRL